MAELCLAEESSVLPLPDQVSDDLAAALGLSAIAAWMALTWRGGLRPGEHVLVLGASGTVGQVAVQAARLLGAGRVVAACRAPHGRARAAEVGADEVADLSGEDADEIARRLAEATGGRADLVLDPVWGRPAEAAVRILAPRGKLVNLGSSAAPQASLASAVLRSAEACVLGYTNAALSPEQRPLPWPRSSSTPRQAGPPPTARRCRSNGSPMAGPGAARPRTAEWSWSRADPDPSAPPVAPPAPRRRLSLLPAVAIEAFLRADRGLAGTALLRRMDKHAADLKGDARSAPAL